MQLKTTLNVIATDSDPDMNEGLRRALAEPTRRPQVTARVLDDLLAEVDAERQAAEAKRIANTWEVRQQAAAEIAANPRVRVCKIKVWGGTSITVPCRASFCTHDHDADAPMHPLDITHQGDTHKVTVTNADGMTEVLISGRIQQEPYGSWGSEPKAVLEYLGEGHEFDLSALDQFIGDFQQQLQVLHQLRAQLAAEA
ncbi:hypothetical protein EDD99_7164 [Streptomyces sp. 846.5]|nr:hypothetical protein [Streptomyces sp. 846.5]TDT95339.1 hypothetical protein EDD99_7164 [Streptomyces sp. 846.5]